MIYIGCAGWSIPKQHAGLFPAEGSHLERYAQRFPAVEINTSFYRPHRPETYARWAASTPQAFRFAVKLPREITHVRRLEASQHVLERFLTEASALGTKLGPLLIQLPPGLPFDAGRDAAFFNGLRQRFAGQVVCEPRHPTWFAAEVERLLGEHQIARAAVDPAPQPLGLRPGGWAGLVYYRLHGSPRMYYSAYPQSVLDSLAQTLRETAERVKFTWCIFDNTAEWAAVKDAAYILEKVEG